MKKCELLSSAVNFIFHKIKKTIKDLLYKIGLSIEKIDNYYQMNEFFNMIKPVSVSCGMRRVGGNGDGGYLLPNDLIGISACFSPGVAFSSFELELAEMGIACYLADFSVDGPSQNHKLFTFKKKFLGACDFGNYMRLDTWIEPYRQNEGDLLLQMDIEGGEYDVILSTPIEILERFRIIVIEFHYLESLVTILGCKLITLTFSKLLEKFEIVHIHPNNCRDPINIGSYMIPPIMEITFMRKDRVVISNEEFVIPNPLDRACDPNRSDFELPNCWYKNKRSYEFRNWK